MALLAFTDPSGDEIHVATSGIVMIRRASLLHDHPEAKTVLATVTGDQAVREDIVVVVGRVMGTLA